MLIKVTSHNFDELLFNLDYEFLFFDVIHDLIFIVQMNQITMNFIKRF